MSEALAVEARPRLEMGSPVGGAEQMKALAETIIPRLRDVMSEAARRYLTPERIAKVALTAASRQPKLYQCTGASLMLAFMKAAEWGLEPNGYHAHLIPRWNRQINDKKGAYEAHYQTDYKGLVELLHRTGKVVRVEAQVIHENELGGFCFVVGARPHVSFQPLLTGEKGKPVGAYALIELTTGGIVPEYMQLDEIEAVRKRSASANDGPWVTDYEMMCRKTVLRRCAKLAPLCEVAQLIAAETADEAETIDTPATVEPIKPGRSRFGPPPRHMAEFIHPPAPQAVEQAPAPEAQPTAAQTETDQSGDADGMMDRAGLVKQIQAALEAGNDAVKRMVEKAKVRADVMRLDDLPVNTLADIAASIGG